MKKDNVLKEFDNTNSILVTILNSIFDGIYVVEKERKIIFWNNGAEKITGYRSEELIGTHCSDDILNHIDENGKRLCEKDCPLEETLKTGKVIRTKVYPLHKNGGRFPVRTHIGPIRKDSGEIIAAIEVFRDISNEEEFRILQEKFNKLVKKYISSATLEEVKDQLQTGKIGKPCIRDLTILNLDVVGFTNFSERHTPAKAVKMLNELFEICDVITKEYHGDIDKFIGDALMAVFIDANDAVSAAIRILEVLLALNKKRSKKGQEEINVRIGINSGLVMQGEIGTPDRKDLTFIGDVVNTTARVQSVAEPMCIYISEATFSRLKNPTIFHEHKIIKVKNRNEPVRIFRYVPFHK